MLFAVILALALASDPVSLNSLINEMDDRDALARFPSPSYLSLQASSYDRKSTSIDDASTWFANSDVSQYIRKETNNGRPEWVMMDADGPGAIVRIWSANPKGTLRIYLDGAAEPAISASMAEILGGTWKLSDAISYEASKGWNLYLPIPYATHCKITSDSDGFYYHVNYRTYEPGTTVESFTMEKLDAAGPDLARVIADLTEVRTTGNPTPTPDETMSGDSAIIAPGASRSLDLPAGPHAINGLLLRLIGDSSDKADVEQRLRSCVLEAQFDGERTIWCPIADFFGSGVGVNEYQDTYRAVGADGRMRCRWVMPYEKSARLTIHNFGATQVNVSLGVRSKAWKWDNRSMHFHAVWRDEYPIHALGAKGTSDFNYVDVTGKGVYVGDVLSIMNPVKEWWGEGDEKIYVDGESFPSHFGTGTEDYYGYAWCWPARFAKPFHAQPRSDGESLSNNWGRTVVTRSRALDAIPFNKSLSMNIEVWHWKECDVEYATTAYFYAVPGAVTNREPDAAAAARTLAKAPELPPPLVIKGAVECEFVKHTTSAGISAVAQGGFGDQLWSSGKQLWVQAAKAGDYVEFKLPAEGKNSITLYATKSWDYGIVRVTVDGQPAGPDIDLCSGKREVVPTGPIELGTFAPGGDGLTIRVELVGKNPKAEGNGSFFGLDCLVVTPVK